MDYILLNASNPRCICCNAVNNPEIETFEGQTTIRSFVLTEQDETLCMTCHDEIEEYNEYYQKEDHLNEETLLEGEIETQIEL